MRLLYLFIIVLLAGCGDGDSTTSSSPYPASFSIPEPKLGTWQQLKPVPEEIMDYTAAVSVNDELIFVSKGGGWRDYLCYSKKENSWSTIAPIPDDKARPYFNLIWLGGDNLYTFDMWGSQGPGIWQYSIIANTWVRLTSYPSSSLVYSGSYAIGKVLNSNSFIYILSSPNDFWQYSISENTWKKIEISLPFPSILMSAQDDSIYGIEIGSNNLWFYSITESNYKMLRKAPVTLEEYSAKLVSPTGRDIFVTRGGTYDKVKEMWIPSNEFYHYSISKDEWTILEPLPQSAPPWTSSLASASDGIYLLIGGANSSLYYLPVSY